VTSNLGVNSKVAVSKSISGPRDGYDSCVMCAALAEST
jgi:hypothetical protein